MASPDTEAGGGIHGRMTLQDARRLLQAEGQEQLLTFWDTLSGAQRAELLQDLDTIDWEALRRSRPASSTAAPEAARLEPVCAVNERDFDRIAMAEAGAGLLRDGRVAALTVAGGMGTRLGAAGPKGVYPATPVKKKSLFEHFAEQILAATRRYETVIPWLIMTGRENHEQTLAFFEQNGFFGLDTSQVRFFQQGVMPVSSPDGRILLAERHRIAFSPDGHGGALKALARSGCLQQLRSDGIRYLSTFQVDNPLVMALDPVFIGLTYTADSEAGSKVVRKAHDGEKVGVFARAGGTLRVIEYMHLPQDLACRRLGDGTRAFDHANIAVHLFDTAFLERITGGGAAQLPWHRVSRKTSCVDLATGAVIEPREANAVKLEQFIFDALPLARDPLLYEVRREEEFSPIKNASGADSPDSARRHLVERAARWLRECGVEISPAGTEPVIEISPLFAQNADELKSRLADMPPPDPTQPIYLGP